MSDTPKVWTAALLVIGAIVTAEFYGATHVNLNGFVPPTLYQEPSFVLSLMAALTSILFATAFMATAISGELRRRQQEVVVLRERLIEEKTEELARVRKLCKIDTLLEQLPGGENFRIKEGGVNLSLGQRHKLALARAILGQPAILIIDEIDANLDHQAIMVLEDVLNDFNGTVLMVSRFEDRLAMADHYWHLKDGKLDTITVNTPASVQMPSKTNNL